MDLRCSKSVLKLLPSRPKSGDKRPGAVLPGDTEKKAGDVLPGDVEKRGGLSADITDKKKPGKLVDGVDGSRGPVQSTVELEKERERPGSLTLRSCLPDHSSSRKPNEKPADGRLKKPEPLGRGARKDPMPAKPYAATLQKGTTTNRVGVPRYRTLSQSLAAGVHRHIIRPKVDSNNNSGNNNSGNKPAGVEVIKQCSIDFGYKKLDPTEVLTYDQFLEDQQKAGKISSQAISAQTLKSEFKDVPVSTQAKVMLKKKDNTVKDGSKKPAGKKNKNNMSSLTSSRSSFAKFTSNSTTSLVTSSKSLKSLQDKAEKMTIPEKQQEKRQPDKKQKECNTVKEVPSILGKQSAAEKEKEFGVKVSTVGDQNANLDKRNLAKPPQTATKKVVPQNSVEIVKKRIRPSSAGSCMSTDSVKESRKQQSRKKEKESQENNKEVMEPKKKEEHRNGNTAVNVSVFTRDNITVSPKDVVVSRTVNRDMTTILVTVPHSSESLFTKTKIGKVEISLDSPSPDILTIVSNGQQPSTNNSKLSEVPESTKDNSNHNSKPGRRWSSASTMSEQSTRSKSPAAASAKQRTGENLVRKSDHQHKRNVEVVDAGYISCTSPLLTPPSPVSLLKRSTTKSASSPTPPKEKRNEPKSSKPSPYGTAKLMHQEKKAVTARSSSRPSTKVELISEPSPYGATNIRYRVLDIESRDQCDALTSRDRSRDVTREPSRDQSKGKLARVSSRARSGNHKNKLKSDEGTRSLPIICKRQKSGFESDLAQNRHRLLLGGVI